MTWNINFARPYNISRNLNFSDDDTHVKIDYVNEPLVETILQVEPPLQLRIEYTNEVVCDIVLANIREVSIDYTFEVETYTHLSYDNSVWRGVVSGVSTGWQAGMACNNTIESEWKDSQRLQSDVELGWRGGRLVESETKVSWKDSKRLPQSVSSGWRDGSPVQNTVGSEWNNGTPLFNEISSSWKGGSPVHNTVGSEWNNGTPLHNDFSSHWHGGQPLQKDYRSKFGSGRPLAKAFQKSEWKGGKTVDSFTFERPNLPPVPPPPVIPPNYNIAFLCLIEQNNNLYFGQVCTGKKIPIRRYYYMAITASVKRVLDDKPIRVSSIKAKLDQSAFNHDFSFTVLGTQSFNDLYEYSPMLLDVAINGIHWTVLVDDPKYSRSFGNNSYSVSGVGLIDELTQEKSSVVFDSDMNVIQIAESVLPNDWTMDYLMNDYLVPANAYSFSDKTQTEVLIDIAKSQGGFILPHRTAKSFKMKSRIPTYTTPDITMPSAVIMSSSRSKVLGQNYNSCYVMGANDNGIIGQVMVTGSNGSPYPSEPFSHPLLTNVIGLRQRGHQELLASKSLYRYNIETLLNNDVPILDDLGMLLQIAGENQETWNGTVTSCEVSVELSNRSPKVRQLLGIDRIV